MVRRRLLPTQPRPALSELGHYIYAQGPNEAVINLYVASTAHFRLDDGPDVLRQEHRYPQDGRRHRHVTPSTDQARFTLAVRIPGWSQPTITLNGTDLRQPGMRDGYLILERRWQPVTASRSTCDLAVRRTWANPAVSAAAGKVALEYGPVVYCLEGVDHDAPVHTLILNREADVEVRSDDTTGVVTLHAEATADTAGHADLYSSRPPRPRRTRLTAVPYFSWANRGLSDMTVWIRENPPMAT